TNTFNLLIAEAGPGTIGKVLFLEEFPVKLGEGGINQGQIAPEAFKRGLETMNRIYSIISHHDPDHIVAMATAAIRSARNGDEFISRVLEETGISIQTIDGNQEAELIFLGVRVAMSLDVPSLIMDIGGGSVELILCDQSGIHWKKSYPLGAARLREKFHRVDPVDHRSLEDLHAYLEDTLEDFFAQCIGFSPVQLIGSAGAFETFDEIIRKGHPEKQENQGPAVKFNTEDLEEVLTMLISSTKLERENLPGLVAFRVDMIVMASVLTAFILRKTGIKNVFLSTYSLKEGMLLAES
ncbi:MAG TPA: exopolyphosphatase, partial [Sphingobacteriaceae bacterium]